MGKTTVYEASVEVLDIPGHRVILPLMDFDSGPVAQGVPPDERFIALIGVDVLARGIFLYDGLKREFCLEFPN